MRERQQYGFVVCVPLNDRPGLARALQQQIDALGNPAREDIRTALDASRCIHFMSMSVIADPDRHADEFLLMEVSGDGSKRMIIDALVEHIGKHLLPIFATAGSIKSLDELKLCFRRYALRAKATLLKIPGRATGLIFQGTPGLSVEEIKQDQEVERIARDAVVTMHRASKGREDTPLDYLDQARKAVAARFNLDTLSSQINTAAPERNVFAIIWAAIRNSILIWVPLVLIPLCAIAAAISVFLGNSASMWLALLSSLLNLWIAGVLAAISFIAAVAIIAGLLLWRLRYHETRDRPKDLDPDPQILREVMSNENQSYAPIGPGIVQNHMTAVSTTKGRFFRHYIVLLLALHVIKIIVTSGMFKPGFLSNIGTIHFASWLRIPGTKRLVFFSNYDGSWESYLEDFITKASAGLTAVWSNTENFPRTDWLVFRGASDGDRFKRWARSQQIPTRFWYTAYPTLTTTQIRTNAAIRAGLANKSPTQSEAEEWLRLFGSAPRPYYALETNEVQSLAFTALRRHLDGLCLLVRFPDGANPNAWLRDLLRDHGGRTLTFGDDEPRARATFLALTATGLEKLGVGGAWADSHNKCDPATRAASFPAAFAFGMADESRSRALGDTHENAPEHWTWGGGQNPVDAALLLYTKTADGEERSLLKARHEEEARLKSHGIEIAAELGFKRLPESGPIREPFGFVDGLSQPVIRGTGKSAKGVSDLHLVEPGEFILGYRDNRNCFPPTPHVPLALDTKSCLPNLAPELTGLEEKSNAWRDFGRNGSFLVIRQLEQHVDAFERFLRGYSSETNEQDWLAAKLVGRWKNGAPLVRYPHGAPETYEHTETENDFLFGQDDPQGLACPFGSHIRRANPRDNAEAASPVQIGITNRHRIMRRGRAYVSGDDPDAKGEGLVFMCLNADIERQFEFVQQTWITSSNFGGLDDETDPVTSTASRNGNGCFTIPMPSGPLRVEGLSSFVTVRGGAYFFLPSKSALRFLSNLENTN